MYKNVLSWFQWSLHDVKTEGVNSSLASLPESPIPTNFEPSKCGQQQQPRT